MTNSIVYKKKKYIIDKRLIRFLSNNITTYGCNISCGITEINYVGSTYSRFMKKRIAKSRLEAHFEYFLRTLKDNYAFVIMSVPKIGNEKLAVFLDSIAQSKTNWEVNPNSKNLIKTWIY